MPIDLNTLLKDLGELCNNSELMKDTLKTYEKRKNLANKLVSCNYSLKNENNSNCYYIQNESAELGLLKDLIKTVQNDSKPSCQSLENLSFHHNKKANDEISNAHKSSEIAEQVCRNLIRNTTFREFFKELLNETKLINEGKKIKIELSVDNYEDSIENHKKKYSIGIYTDNKIAQNSTSSATCGHKRKYQHKSDEGIETQVKKMKSILKIVEPVKRECKIKKKQRFSDLKPNIQINSLFYTE